MPENKMFKVLFENMTSGAAIYEVQNDGLYGKDYIIRGFNKVSRDIEGKILDEVIGKSLFDIRPTIDEYGLIEVFRQVWKTGKPAHFPSKQYIDEDYSNWYENQVFRLPTGEIVAMYNDVTEKEQRAAELNKKNSLLSAFLENAPYGVFIVNGKTQYIQVNNMACKITGYSKEELLSMKIADLFPQPISEKSKGTFRKLAKEGTVNENKQFIKKNGEIRTWNLSAVKIDDNTFIGFAKDITDEENLKIQIQNTAEEYKALFDNAGLGIGYYTLDGAVIWYNRIAAENMGGKPEDFTGKTLDELFPIEAAKEYKQRLIRALKSKDKIEYEDSLELPIGSVTYYSTYNCIKNSENEIIGIQIISQDITEIKKTEKALLSSRRDYKVLFDEAPLGYQSLDIDGNFITVNNMWLEMLGFSEEEVIGHNFSEFLHPDYVPMFHENFPDFKRVGSTCAIFTMVKKNGDCIVVRFDGKIVYDENGIFEKTQCMVQDITYAQEMEKRLKESENKFRDMFEEAPMGYQLMDIDGKLLDVNKAWLNIFGYSKEEAIGTNGHLLVTDSYKDALKDYIVNLWESGKNSIELEAYKKNGQIAYIRFYGRVIKDENGEFLRTIGLVQDITDVKVLEKINREMEVQLRNQQKLESIGILAGGVAHEINNPINGIMNYGQLILDTLGDDTECSEYAREIIHESQRVSSIVKDLLQFSGQQKQQFQEADIGDIIKHTISLIGTIMKHDQIELVVDIEKDIPEVKCKSRQVQQVLMNLLTNARDSLNDKFEGYNQYKIIKLKCKTIKNNNNPWIQISISDNGNGIPEPIQDNIFDPFFTSKSRDEGTGLGLSISYGIVQEHRGQLYFKTEINKGTTFYVDLPIV